MSIDQERIEAINRIRAQGRGAYPIVLSNGEVVDWNVAQGRGGPLPQSVAMVQKQIDAMRENRGRQRAMDRQREIERRAQEIMEQYASGMPPSESVMPREPDIVVTNPVMPSPRSPIFTNPVMPKEPNMPVGAMSSKNPYRNPLASRIYDN